MQKKGFISLIFMIVVALIVLFYLQIPLSKILASPWASKIAHVIKDIVTQLWKDFILLFQFGKDIVDGNK